MKHDIARKVLADYRQAVASAEREQRLLAQDWGGAAALNAKVPAVNRVLRELAPDLPLIKATNLTQHLSARTVLDKAEALLDAWGKWDDAIVDYLPALPMLMLDSVVADAALPLWKAGKYRQAVSEAATHLNLFAQQQLGRRDISDKSLMGEAFSDKPPELGKARLRCYRLGRPMESVHSQQEGARAFCTGTFQAIRNPAHHLTGDWNPVTAFHYLVALSQVAHYFREWKIVTYSPPPGP